MAKFTKENPRPGPGRPKGVPNKTTRAMKEMWLEAFERVGGVEYLVEAAQSDKTAATFMQGLLRQIPNEVAAKVAAELTIKLIDLSGDRKEGDGIEQK